MQYRLYDIDPRLKPFVKVICSVESEPAVVSPVPLRVLPDACVELFVNFGEPQQVVSHTTDTTLPVRSFITSRMSNFMDVKAQRSVNFLSICFYSGRAYPFFQVPMHDLANQLIDLGELWGRCVDDMQERMDRAKTMAQRVQLIQQYLVARLQKLGTIDSGVDFCIGQVNQANGQLSLEELANRVGISNRQLIRRFNQFVGLSPKEFARITSFLNALKQLKKYPALSLTEIAYESAYYDQAHFIHACRAYSGLTPSQLVTSTNVLY